MIVHEALGRTIRSLVESARRILVMRFKSVRTDVVSVRIFCSVQRRMPDQMRAPGNAGHHQRTRDQESEDGA